MNESTLKMYNNTWFMYYTWMYPFMHGVIYHVYTCNHQLYTIYTIQIHLYRIDSQPKRALFRAGELNGIWVAEPGWALSAESRSVEPSTACLVCKVPYLLHWRTLRYMARVVLYVWMKKEELYRIYTHIYIYIYIHI